MFKELSTYLVLGTKLFKMIIARIIFNTFENSSLGERILLINTGFVYEDYYFKAISGAQSRNVIR